MSKVISAGVLTGVIRDEFKGLGVSKGVTYLDKVCNHINAIDKSKSQIIVVDTLDNKDNLEFVLGLEGYDKLIYSNNDIPEQEGLEVRTLEGLRLVELLWEVTGLK